MIFDFNALLYMTFGPFNQFVNLKSSNLPSYDLFALSFVDSSYWASQISKGFPFVDMRRRDVDASLPRTSRGR